MFLIDVISGYTQHEGRPHGCMELEEQLLSNLDDYSSLSVRVKYNPWNANWKQVAYSRYMLKQRYPDEPWCHMVCSYSYGVGHGTVRLAQYMDQYGMQIDMAVICDGIYRHFWKKWRSLYGEHNIKLPDNILAYHGYHQEKSRPMGCKPTGKATCESWEKLFVIHTEMDDHHKWHNKCVDVAKKLASLFCTKSGVPAGAPISVATVCRSNDGAIKELT